MGMMGNAWMQCVDMSCNKGYGVTQGRQETLLSEIRVACAAGT